MPDSDDYEAEWFGRPQDDPRLLAGAAAARQKFRQDFPPLNCWIDRVMTIELFVEGALRAIVKPDNARIFYLDAQGSTIDAVTFLRSENPYDVAEAHLGIGPITEIRDESLDAMEVFSAEPRERAERAANGFREYRADREDEIFDYLRSAVDRLRFAMRGGFFKYDLSPLLAAISSAVLDEYEAALEQVKVATSPLEEREASLVLEAGGLADCRRAILAIERHIAHKKSRTSVGRKPEGGKSGG